MQSTTQNITSLDWAQMGITDMRKKRLTVEFDAAEVSIFINNSYKPPISWFLTDDSGQMLLHGQIEDAEYYIDLTDLPTGIVYSLRIAGEIHIIHNV